MAPITSILAGLALVVATTVSAEDLPDLEIQDTNHVTCSRPSRNGDKISVHYRGRLQSNGEEFDESYRRGAPFTFTLGAHMVIDGWDKGLLDMCPGQKRTLIIPPHMAYGHRGIGSIPPDSTLVFSTELVEIVGVKQDLLSTLALLPTPSVAVTSTVSSSTEEGNVFSIATAPPVPQDGDAGDKSAASGLVATPLGADKDKGKDPTNNENGECQLLGPFALLVQAALGAVALLSLIWKRYRETPKRPWKIFTFDVSKQVLGSMLTHVLNLAMSMLGSGEILDVAKSAAIAATDGSDGHQPNPCSFYLLNLAIDTTIGIPVLYILLRLLHAVALRTPLARPPQSIKTGNYDRPPRATWWLKQLFIYFLGLVGMKLFVLFLFKAMPWLPWVGDWALRWTRGNEALEITFAMFIFPLIMNGAQYWIIDNLIKEKSADGGKGYKHVHDRDEDEDENARLTGDRDDEYTVDSTDDTIVVESDTLKAANPTPIPDYQEDTSHGSSYARTTSAPR